MKYSLILFAIKVGLSVGTSQHPAPHRKSGTEVVIQVKCDNNKNRAKSIPSSGKPCCLCRLTAAGGISSAQEIHQGLGERNQTKKAQVVLLSFLN